VLTSEDRRVERILLELRLRNGLPSQLLRPAGIAAAHRHVESGLLERRDDNLVLTTRGRLLADALVRDLVD
jgi:oxygen-independent coproporphyrinogen-3 oxidase